MKNIKNSAVAEKSLAAHRLLKIISTEDKSYQISAENCLRKRDWYGLVHFSQRKRGGNAAETRNATWFCSYVFPPSGNVTETWTIRFPQDFRNTETPYFTLCKIVRALWLAERSVCMRVCKHGCGVKLFGCSRANHASTNLKKLSSSKL